MCSNREGYGFQLFQQYAKLDYFVEVLVVVRSPISQKFAKIKFPLPFPSSFVGKKEQRKD